MTLSDLSATRAMVATVALAALTVVVPLHAQPVVPPLPVQGPYPVACSNVEQDFARVPAGETASMYWDGVASGGVERYVTQLLVDPANALVTTFTVPNDTSLFDRWAGQPVTYALIACYPTTPENSRAGYSLPNGLTVPRMQRGGEPPLFAASPARHPLVLFSHGYGGSPLAPSYFEALLAWASWGYVTVAPFHGDLRYSVFGPDAGDGGGAVYVPVWDEFVAMQATRPLSLSAALDRLVAHPQWRDRIDGSRVGGFGVSQGGETLMLLAGAALTNRLLTVESKRVTQDARLRAAVGYIPYFGLGTLPAFGRDQNGAGGLALPYLAISGRNDNIAPADVTRRALDRMTGVRGQVLVGGSGHNVDATASADVFTWSVGFLAAWVKDDATARSKLAQATSVEGGLDDLKDFYVDPTGSGGGGGEVVDTIEYYSASLDHYFITAFPEEAAMLDEGVVVPGWKRTGFGFRAWKAGSGPGSDACRFFGTPGRGPNSHFYTINAAECDKVKANPDWTYEALALRAVEPLQSGCAGEYATVTRLYNNGMGGQANHRYLVDPAEVQRMAARGWLVEGPVFCVPR
jgi:predicted dienelactone hydrolase